jgi:glutamate N-acetyltransferase/amino-acid N-acetyltransferase
VRWTLREGALLPPAGFRAAAARCGLRRGPGTDLGLLVADPPAAAAALFTRNLVRAAPVGLSAQHLRRSRGRCAAILANAGCANAATGAAGRRAAEACARAVAGALGLRADEVLLASTGVIGVLLDASKVLPAIPSLARGATRAGLAAMARAILTTDTRAKLATATTHVGRRTVTVAGFAKGAGMIHPDLATMLVFLVTDAAATPGALRAALREAADASFHRISVDGDTSTNDSVFALASGASGVRPGPGALARGLEAVCRSLALQIVRDGEGARRLLLVRVEGARSAAQARAAARAVGTSLLVRTAVAGGDPNWGRILAALGRSGVRFDPARIGVGASGVPLFRRGAPAPSSGARKRAAFGGREVRIEIDLAQGHSSEEFWTCDLTEGYVRVNASYTT